MAELETQKNNTSVSAFLNAIDDDQQRKDAKAIAKMMRQITGARPAMWGTSIVGYGEFHYKYASGREGDWFLTGFSPRKQNLSLYIMDGFKGRGPLLKKLGKHKTGKGCLYVRRLADVDLEVLHQLIEASVASKSESPG